MTVWIQKMSLFSLQRVTGNTEGREAMGREGVLKTKVFKGKYRSMNLTWNNQSSLCLESMDIFWNNNLAVISSCNVL